MGYQTLMLIDDDEDDHEIFLAALQELPAPVTCHSYTSAGEALKRLTARELRPEVIFLDLNMPVMNGLQFLVEIKKTAYLADIPIIIFSTSSHRPTMELTKELGASAFITKPNSFDALVQILMPIIL